jgi:hypothetical protein
MNMTVETIRLGTRLFNAGKLTDPVALMKVGNFKALVIGFGDPAIVEDLVVLENGEGPEPFEIENPAKVVEGLEGFPAIWLAQCQSLLRFIKKES